MPYKRLKIVKGCIDWVLGPPLRFMGRVGVRPIHLTLLSLPCGLLGVWFLYSRPLWGFLFVVSYVVLDVLDGTLARVTGTESEYGASLDFLVDRVVAVCFLISYYLNGGGMLLPAVGLTAILAVSLEDLGLIKR